MSKNFPAELTRVFTVALLLNDFFLCDLSLLVLLLDQANGRPFEGSLLA